MPRRPRVILPDIPLHIIQRGHNREPCFLTADDHAQYLAWLGHYASDSGCLLHGYVLMTNHTHLLLTPSTVDAAASLMKALGQRYTQHFNRNYRRTGTLWESRFRSCLVQDTHYLLACQRYIELNPVRAAMVTHPAEYRWSSYSRNGQGESNALITPHSEYMQLGHNDATRQTVYRELFRISLEPGLVDEIRQATHGNFALGHPAFAASVAALLNRRVTKGKAGRQRTEAMDS